MTKQWGTPTWYFLHTLAEKIKEETYIKHRDTIISFIKNTCNNLPCGYCSDHAKLYVRNLNSKNVPTKEHLKQFLFAFHNDVNKKTNRAYFSNYNRYETANLSKMFEYFRYWYCQSSALSKKFADSRRRKRIVKSFGDYLLQHQVDFIWG